MGTKKKLAGEVALSSGVLLFLFARTMALFSKILVQLYPCAWTFPLHTDPELVSRSVAFFLAMNLDSFFWRIMRYPF